jgi:hypothetical protein
MDDSEGPAQEIEPLPQVQTGELAIQTLSGQYASRISM